MEENEESLCEDETLVALAALIGVRTKHTTCVCRCVYVCGCVYVCICRCVCVWVYVGVCRCVGVFVGVCM